jgi:hypothetical protein
MKTEMMIQPEVRAHSAHESDNRSSSVRVLLAGVQGPQLGALQDVAEAVMLAVRTKQSCTPSDITLRPTEPVQPLD